MKIDEPDLKKGDGEVCPKLVEGRCSIYHTRPTTCRTWFCGWRLMKIGEKLRPDRSGVLLIPEIGTSEGVEGKGGFAFAFLDTRPPSFKNDELIDLAGQMVSRGLPVYLVYGAGGEAQRLLVNGFLKSAIDTRDRAAFVRTINALLADLVARVQATRTAPQNG